MKKLSATQRRFLDNATLMASLQLVFTSLEKSSIALSKLGDIAMTTSGGTPDRRVNEYYEGNIPWIKSGELNDGLIEESEEYITNTGLQNSSSKIYQKGTLVVALYGATVGKVGILTIDAASNQAVCAIVPNAVLVSTKFLFWFLRYKRSDFLNSSFGAAQPNISQRVLRETILPLPTSELQEKICSFLEMVELRQKGLRNIILPNLPSPLSEIQRIVVSIEELATKVGKARELHQKAVIVAEALNAATTNALLNLTEVNDWPMVELGDIADIHAGVTLGRTLNGTTIRLPYLRVANVQDGFLDLNNIKETDLLPTEFEKWQLKSGDILLTEGGDWDKLGRGAVWHAEIPDCIHQNHIFCVRTNPDDFNPNFLLAVISSPYGKAYFQRASKQTTNLASINQKQLKAFKVFQPPLPEQERIVSYLNDLQAKVSMLKVAQTRTSTALDAMLPSILDKAFKGEL